MNLDDALQTFILEARDLLQQMEDALLQLEKNPNDTEGIDAIFRAAHTIKGSSGLFGLDFVVNFTHVAESVLDKVRSGEIAIDESIVALFLEVCDHIGRLVEHVAEGTLPNEDTETMGGTLLQQLNVYLHAEHSNIKTTASKNSSHIVEAEQFVSVENTPISDTDHWHISIRFGLDTFRNGMDPFSFVRYMNTLGNIVHIVTITDTIPSLEAMDAESCYLGLEISYHSNASKEEIENIFDFIKDDSEIHILPPHSKVEDFIHLIDSLTENELKLGEILVRCGSLTPAELEKILAKQADVAPENKQPIGEVLAKENIVQPAVIAAALDKQKQVKDSKTAEANLIRVDANKLDQLINMVGELIIAGASASLTANKIGIPEMTEATSVISDLVEQVRDSALSLRMVQIGATFSRFQRVVRDVSKELGKDIRLEISGEETELDKTVVEKIGDPLTHLVRNSMDHGIEPADVRIAKGKPAYGTLKLNAYHDAGSIVIEVSDDGAGLNRDKILAKAIERGLVKEDQQLSDNDIYNLIFEAGFSTADAVSNLSGRGVGMDVVKRNIQALRGTVMIHSEPGKGAIMRIRLPLTLAIIDGFLVNVAGSEYVIPLDMVVECMELSAEEQTTSQNRGSNLINLRGEVLSYLKLRDQFECEGEPPARQNVVVAQYGNQKIGLVVDKLLGEFQAVIKPLGKVFGQVKGISGFTILGNGNVALVLDIPRMMLQAAEEGVTDATALV